MLKGRHWMAPLMQRTSHEGSSVDQLAHTPTSCLKVSHTARNTVRQCWKEHAKPEWRSGTCTMQFYALCLGPEMHDCDDQRVPHCPFLRTPPFFLLIGCLFLPFLFFCFFYIFWCCCCCCCTWHLWVPTSTLCALCLSNMGQPMQSQH